jgi:hypothetical protein
MKKKEGVRKKTRFPTKTLFLGLLVLLVLGFALNFINPQQNLELTGHGIQESIITPWEQGSVDVIVARYVMFFIILILIYSILGMAFGSTAVFIRFVLALLISFLFTGYVLPGEILAISIGFSAVGVTIMAIIPFFILMLLTATMLTERKIGAGHALLERFLWLFFFVFLVYKLINFWGTTQGEVTVSNPVMVILVVVAILSFAVFLWHRAYLRVITNTLVSAYSNIRAFVERRRRENTMDIAERNQRQMREDFNAAFGEGNVRY